MNKATYGSALEVSEAEQSGRRAAIGGFARWSQYSAVYTVLCAAWLKGYDEAFK